MTDTKRHHEQLENELEELIEDYRTDIQEMQNAGVEYYMTEAQQRGYIEGLATACNALEELLHDD